jgi:hypothetical protein
MATARDLLVFNSIDSAKLPSSILNQKSSAVLKATVTVLMTSAQDSKISAI